MPVMTAARLANKKAMFVADKIKVDGHLYGVTDMNQLPSHLSPAKGCVRETEDTICFFGRHTPYSNFFQRRIKVEDWYFNCVEQFLQTSKAELLLIDRIASKILAEPDPAKQKGLAEQITGDEAL